MTTEWNAAGYHRVNALQKWLAEESLARLSLQSTDRVLDVGCGDGRVTAELARQVPQGAVLGVDPSHQMVDYARQTYPEPNLRFEVGDARALQLDSRFNRLVSFNALHWVPRADFSAAMTSLRQALEPSGTAHLRFVGLGLRQSLESVASEVAPSHSAPFTHFTPNEFRELAGRHGWRVDHLEMLDRHWDFSTREEFVSWARVTFVEWTRELPEEAREGFIEEVLERYEKVTGVPNRFAFYQMVSQLS
ncbi:MAG: hypothetical protein AMXMBFR33_62020 [Candidatus Xenobia bacterium]